jgi:uncharacterized membrane protein
MLPSVLGVTIHGTVYDFGLSRLPDSVIEINSTPKQLIVAKDGSYSFSVPPGVYSLKARHEKSDSEVIENVSAVSEGEYVLDLITLPSLGGDEELVMEEPEIMEDVITDKPVVHWLLWVVVFVVLGYLVYKISKKPQKIVEKVTEVVREVKEVAVVEELQKVLEFIEKEGGRTTQKDIRKNFPYSEAKISLMIDDLEAKGLVKKVKKGRGNIIIKS